MVWRRRLFAACTVAAVVLVGGCSSDDGVRGHSEPRERPTAGPEYEAAMKRCALSRLRNAGVENPSTESFAFTDAYTMCTYGPSFDDVGGLPRGFGKADPGYWTE